eukprot:a176706_112.p1 GENE.a176706_112~~a176706_112.p1  ORF type:complete len:262 (-),score=80.84 a176706_112:143-901(-)
MAARVEEEEDWARSLHEYEREKRWAPETRAVEVVTFSKIQQRQAAFNPLTSRYRDVSAEKREREREQAARAAAEARSHASLHAKHRGYNVISNLTSSEHVEAPLGESRVRAMGAPPPSYVSPPAFRSRRTTNHTLVSYDVISNEALPPDHESLAPTIRSGVELPVDVIEGSRVAKRRIEHDSETRTFDIVTGRSRDAAAFASPPSPFSAGVPVSPDRSRGKRQFSKPAEFNILNGESLTPSGVTRSTQSRWV